MNNKNVTRRTVVQTVSTLLLGSAIAPALSAQNASSLQEDPKMVFIPPDGGLKGKISKSDITFKLDKSQTSGLVGSAELLIPPGQLGAPPHYHKNFDEICIVLEGAVQIMVEEEVIEVKKGGWHLRPRGKVHTLWNSGKENAKVIELYTPGGHEDYMRELSSLFANNNRPNPGDLQKLASKNDIVFRFDLLEKVMKKYSVTL